MLRKLLAITTLLGAPTIMVAACSSAPGDGADASTPDAAPKSDSSPPPTDASISKKDASPPTTCEQNISGKASEVKKAIDDASRGFGPYKSTPPSSSQCSAANIAAFKSYLASLPSNATYDDVIKKLTEINPGCATCTFKAQTGATWGPFVTVKTSSGGTGAFSNLAGCYEALGVSLACATAIHYFDKCAAVACSACKDSEESQCRKDTYGKGGQCATEFGPGIATACKDDQRFAPAGKVCEKQGESIIVNLMTGACGPTSSDAGAGG